MSSVAHVERNVALADAPPDEMLLAGVRALLAPVTNVVWREGRPENWDPGSVEKQS